MMIESKIDESNEENEITGKKISRVNFSCR